MVKRYGFRGKWACLTSLNHSNIYVDRPKKTTRPSLITHYNWAKQGIIITHRLNKLLTSLQSQSLQFIKQCRTNLVQIFCFPRSSTKMLRILSSSSIIQRVIRWLVESIPELFRSYKMFEQLLVVHCLRHLQDFHCHPKILLTIQKPMYERQYCLTYACFISWKVSVAVLPILNKI
jgi:hypothetical protein